MPGELQRFLGPMIEPLDKPRRRFVTQMIGRMVAAGSLVVTQIARHVPDGCSDLFYHIKRLLRQLSNTRWVAQRLWEGYLSWAARCIQPDTPLLIDMTDLGKVRARRMPYLQWIRDGDQDRLVPDYWLDRKSAGTPRSYTSGGAERRARADRRIASHLQSPARLW